MANFGNIVCSELKSQDQYSKVSLSYLPTGTVGITQRVYGGFGKAYLSDDAGEREYTGMDGYPSGTLRTYDVMLGNGTGSTSVAITAETKYFVEEPTEHNPLFFGLLKTGEDEYTGYYYVHYYDAGDSQYYCRIRKIVITHGGAHTDSILLEIDMSDNNWWHGNSSIVIDKNGYLGVAHATLEVGGGGDDPVGYDIQIYKIDMVNGTVSKIIDFDMTGNDDNRSFPDIDRESIPLALRNSNGTLAWATLYTNFDYINCSSTTYAIINGNENIVKQLIDTSFPCGPPGQSAREIKSAQYNLRDYLFMMRFTCDDGTHTIIYTPTGGYQVHIEAAPPYFTPEPLPLTFVSKRAYPAIVEPFGQYYRFVDAATGETGDPFAIYNSTGTVATGTSSNMAIYPTLDALTGYMYIGYDNKILGVDPLTGEIMKEIPIAVGATAFKNHGNFFLRYAFSNTYFTYIDNGYAPIAVNECIIIEHN